MTESPGRSCAADALSAAAGSRGAALAIVLWALIALGTLSLAAASTATLDLAVAGRYRDHSAALMAAEAGLAEALAAVAADPARGARSDSLAGILETGAFRAQWAPAGEGFRIVTVGTSGTAVRTTEARASSDAGGALWIDAWREIR